MRRDDVVEATFLEGLDIMDPAVGCEVTGTGRQVGDYRGIESPQAPTLGFFGVSDFVNDAQNFVADAAATAVGGSSSTGDGGGHWESPGMPPEPSGGGLGDSYQNLPDRGVVPPGVIEDNGGILGDGAGPGGGLANWAEPDPQPKKGGWWAGLSDGQKLALAGGAGVLAFLALR